MTTKKTDTYELYHTAPAGPFLAQSCTHLQPGKTYVMSCVTVLSIWGHE